jgi:hypothetical protein
MAILLASLVLVSLVVERSGKASLPVSFAAVGGRRMLIGANRGLADQRRTLDDLRDGDDPLSGSKRRVPNGPDPIHNRYHLFLACPAFSHSVLVLFIYLRGSYGFFFFMENFRLKCLKSRLIN